MTLLPTEDATPKMLSKAKKTIWSVLFDNKYYDREKATPETKGLIDTFFTRLNGGSDFGSALNFKLFFGAEFTKMWLALDHLDRYAYIGSSSLPPCDQPAYVNVLRTVQPIRQTDVDKIRSYMSAWNNRYFSTADDGIKGNYRVSQDRVEEQEFRILTRRASDEPFNYDEFWFT